MRNFYDDPSAVTDYIEISSDLIAKTGTAQLLYKQTVLPSDPAVMKDNVWFAAIAYPKHSQTYDDPELAVVVFLRYRHAGREGGTIAAQVIKKWRELNQLNNERK